jgi:thiamine biosynthesis lipoprotein
VIVEALALLIAAAPPACDRAPEGWFERAERHMGTYVRVGFAVPRADLDCQALDVMAATAFAEFARLEDLLSEWREGTQLAAVNAAAGERGVVVDEELFSLIERARDFAARSHGAFDPTFAALWGLWTFGDDGVNAVPDQAELERRRALIGWERIVVDPDTRSVFLPEAGMKIGLGGIAKGYAVDRAVDRLRDAGIDDLIVQAGGETFLAGRPRGRAPQAGVRDPRGPGPFAIVEHAGAINTSGDYERFFVVDGVRYHHLIDPATARPARRARSATVLADDATTADALATAVFVLGPVRGMALIEATDGAEAIVVGADNRIWLSSGVPDGVELQPPSDGP